MWADLRIESNNVGKFDFIESFNVRRKNRISARISDYKSEHLHLTACYGATTI